MHGCQDNTRSTSGCGWDLQYIAQLDGITRTYTVQYTTLMVIGWSKYRHSLYTCGGTHVD